MASRWEAFSKLELETLWQEIVFDDGAMYRPEPDSIEFALLGEIEHEWQRRYGLSVITLATKPATPE